MKIKAWVGAAVIAVCAVPVTAMAAPDQWAFARKMSDISDFLFAQNMCEIADYKVHPESFAKLWDPAVMDAVQSGIPVATVTQISGAAFDTREADNKRIVQDFMDKVWKAFTDEGADAVMERVEDHFNYVDAKCRGFAESAQFGALITAPDDPDNKAGFVRFARSVSDKLKEAIEQ
jgi:hypothetical protein